MFYAAMHYYYYVYKTLSQSYTAIALCTMYYVHVD